MCPLDCFDACGLIATVEDGRVESIRGDRQHPLTAGFCCKKGAGLLERLVHPRRLRSPLLKRRGQWRSITVQEAMEVLAVRLGQAIRDYGSAAIANYSDSGYGGLAKKVDQLFFNHIGGASVPRGSLCWGAGIAAQQYDFGRSLSHHPEDHTRAKTIVLWGRNPAETNIHLIPYLKRARKNGAEVVLIDPRRSASAALADWHIPVRPATDGALAIGMCRMIVDNRWHNEPFIFSRVKGFERFRSYLDSISLERIEKICGVPLEVMEKLACRYATAGPSCIIVGYGLQRYGNGGSTVRCIDALGAVTGNIGIRGGGVNYAGKSLSGFIGGELLNSEPLAKNRRTFALPRMADFLLGADDPPVKCLVVSKANPLVQVPNIHRTLEAFSNLEFTAVIDMFMTDTAAHADLVLPCTSVLEEEDIIYSSMFSPYIGVSSRVVDAPEGVVSEYDFFRQLARRMGIRSYPDIERREYLLRAIQPLQDAFGIGYDDLKSGYFCLPPEEIPWNTGEFATPSGKYELYCERALAHGHSPTPAYIEPSRGDDRYPLRLITPHWRDSIHSQQFAFVDGLPEASISCTGLARYGLEDGKPVRIRSRQGELTAIIRKDQRVIDDVIVIYQGWWHKSGSVNLLTPDALSDLGEQAAYYDCFVRVEPL